MNPIKEIPESQNEPEPHRDERQIRLDTDRSFVLYPTMVQTMVELHVRQSSTTSSSNFSGDTPV